MRPTVEFLQERFGEFNRICFGGELPPLPIRLSRARTYMGQLHYTVHRTGMMGRTRRLSDFEIRISTHFDLPQHEVEDTLIHEMIHYYIHVKGWRDSSAHGRLFRQLMQHINRAHGRHITVSHRGPLPPDERVRTHLVGRVTFADGHVGMVVAAHTRVAWLQQQLPRHFSIERIDWYQTDNPWFNRFPRVRSLKIYVVEREELDRQLSLHTMQR